MGPTPEQQSSWDAWVSNRPAAVRDALQKYDLKPWKLYRLKSTGQRVTLYSVDEPKDGAPPTLKVDVDGRFNLVSFSRRVFGVSPDDLEECDLPSDAEPLGAILSADELGAVVAGVPPGQARVEAIRSATDRAIRERAPKGDA